MSKTFVLVRNAVLMAIFYFTLLYLVDKFVIKVMDTTSITIGILIPSVMLGLALGEKFRKKA